MSTTTAKNHRRRQLLLLTSLPMLVLSSWTAIVLLLPVSCRGLQPSLPHTSRHRRRAAAAGRQRGSGSGQGGRITTIGIGGTTALGPVARNGLMYTDVTIGDGRRILPGDIVQCYYKGSYQKKSGNGGMLMLPQLFGGGDSAGNTVVFDAIQESDGPPFAFPIGKGQVIQGWDLGILGKVGYIYMDVCLSYPLLIHPPAPHQPRGCTVPCCCCSPHSFPSSFRTTTTTTMCANDCYYPKT
jgi:FKBP-type peptidyl-prolyl cis-trans isomerase